MAAARAGRGLDWASMGLSARRERAAEGRAAPGWAHLSAKRPAASRWALSSMLRGSCRGKTRPRLGLDWASMGLSARREGAVEGRAAPGWAHLSAKRLGGSAQRDEGVHQRTAATGLPSAPQARPWASRARAWICTQVCMVRPSAPLASLKPSTRRVQLGRLGTNVSFEVRVSL